MTILYQSGYYFTLLSPLHVNYNTISRYSAGSSLHILKIPQGFNLARYNALNSVERFAQTHAVSNRCTFNAGLSVGFPAKHAYYVYRALRISTIPYLISDYIRFHWRKIDSTGWKNQWVKSDSPTHLVCHVRAICHYLSEIEMWAVLRFLMFIRDNWHIDPFSHVARIRGED